MEAAKNPFSPGAGAQPPELVGREPILEQGRVLLARIKAKRPEKSMLLTGLRGVGKTVLLNKLEQMARESGYRTAMIEAHEGKTIAGLIAQPMREILHRLDLLKGAASLLREALGTLRGFMGVFKVKSGDFEIDIEPRKGTADSGDIEIDLPQLFVVIGEAAADRKTAVAIFVDELQYLNSKELGALIMAMHRIQQKQLPLTLIGAGLPTLPALAGDSKSYAERLFSFPEIGALSGSDVEKALREPIDQAGARIEDEALAEVFRTTKGYPYFVQEWGSQAWNLAPSLVITKDIVVQANAPVIARLDKSFFRVRYDRLTPGEQKVLRAMAELGPGPHRIGDLATILKKKKAEALGPVRSRLIKKGMIYSPAHGELAFTVPLFDEFMKRTIPVLEI